MIFGHRILQLWTGRLVYMLCLCLCMMLYKKSSANSPLSSSSCASRLLATSSAMANWCSSSFSSGTFTCKFWFWQLVHWQPSVHCRFCLLHPHTLFLQPVEHLQPFNKRWSLSHIAAIFSFISHTMQSLWLWKVHPYSVIGSRTMLLQSAWAHICRTQHVLFQCKYNASVEGTMLFSNVVL